jgi:hypothetical protein
MTDQAKRVTEINGRPLASLPKQNVKLLLLLSQSIMIIVTTLKYIHTYHSRLILGGVAEASQIFLRDSHVYQNYLTMGTADETGGKPVTVWSQSIAGANAINHLVAFYDIHGRKREVLFFYSVPGITRDYFEIKWRIFKIRITSDVSNWRLQMGLNSVRLKNWRMKLMSDFKKILSNDALGWIWSRISTYFGQ